MFLKTGVAGSVNNQTQFKFELGWLLRDGFFDMVKDVWQSVQKGNAPSEKWQAKIRRLRQYLRGWAKNISGVYKKEKKMLLNKLNELDIKPETTSLDANEINLKHSHNNRLAELLRKEELKWYQRAKVKNLLEGDANTKYVQLVANGKHRKTCIFQLEQEEGVICGDNELKKFITKYYKKLFGPPDNNFVSMDVTLCDNIPQVSPQENEFLVASFSENEIKEAIFQMKSNTAPGPDGFPPEFYQVFWNVIKEDLIALFEEFHRGSLSLHSLNYGTIILLPKSSEAKQIQQYRPICLLNVSFKIFTKVATNRITKIAQRIIMPTQTAFLPGRNITDSAVILHETIHELHTKNINGVIFKIDFEKSVLQS